VQQRQVVAEMDGAIARGDLETFLTFLTDDFVDMPPGEESVVGKAALEIHHRPLFAAFDLDVLHNPIETTVIGEAVVQRGNATGTIRPTAGGETITLDQKYLVVFRRQPDGSFKLWRAIFNDNPPQDDDGAP
jgi:ketosteroid isomerase-like protein